MSDDTKPPSPLKALERSENVFVEGLTLLNLLPKSSPNIFRFEEILRSSQPAAAPSATSAPVEE